MIVTLLLGLALGLAIFLLGLHTLSRGMAALAGTGLQRVLTHATATPLTGMLAGTVVTALLQSSSATNVLMVGLVHAGLLDVRRAFGVILGANVGTTITGQLLAWDVSSIALPLVAVGILMRVCARGRGYARHGGEAVAGFGGLFFGMEVMRGALHPLTAGVWPSAVAWLAADAGWLAAALGTLVTMTVQSSSAATGFAMAMAKEGLMGLRGAVAFSMGANIGTVATTLLASIGTSPAGRRTAVADLVFNVMGVLVVLPVLPWFVELVAGAAVGVERQVAHAHTVFNLVTALVALPLIGPILWVVDRIVPERR